MRTRLLHTAAVLAVVAVAILGAPAVANAVQGATTLATPLIFRAGLVTSGQITGTPNNQPTVNVPITPVDQVAAGSLLTLYSDARCTVAVGLGTLGAAGSATTITVTINPPGTTEYLFYQATPGFGCAQLDSIPGAPSVTGTNPPTNGGLRSSNLSPLVVGYGLSNSTIQLYTDSNCTVTYGSLTPTNADNTFEIDAPNLPPNSTITFFARQFDAKGDSSPCSSALPAGGSVQYFTGAAPSGLYLNNSAPISPSSQAQPQISGAGGQALNNTWPDYVLFLDNQCGNQLNPQPGLINRLDGTFTFVFAVPGGPTLPVGTTTFWVGQPALGTCSGFGGQPGGFPYTVLQANPLSAPTLTGSSGQGPGPTFQVTGAAANSIVYLYANTCDASQIDDTTTYADSNGNAFVQPANPVTGPMNFVAQYQTATGFSPCSQALFYTP